MNHLAADGRSGPQTRSISEDDPGRRSVCFHGSVSNRYRVRWNKNLEAKISL